MIFETEEENDPLLKVIEKLMDKGEALSPEEEKLLKLLTKLVEDFERQYYKPRDASPLEVLTAFDGVTRSEANSPLAHIWLERHCLRSSQRQAWDK